MPTNHTLSGRKVMRTLSGNFVAPMLLEITVSVLDTLATHDTWGHSGVSIKLYSLRPIMLVEYFILGCPKSFVL